METFTTSYVAQVIGISKASITNWSYLFFPGMPKSSSGHKLFTKEQIEFLKKVKKLSNQGVKMLDIKSKLADELEALSGKTSKEQNIENTRLKNTEIIKASNCTMIPNELIDSVDENGKVCFFEVLKLLKRMDLSA